MYKNYFETTSEHLDTDYQEDSELLLLEDHAEMCRLIKSVKVVEKDSEVKYYEPDMWFMYHTDHIDAGDKITFIRK